ncbi:hypothetical protein [Clostridium sp. D33t1_170424_F3]|uniref:hypothetical protein n=1 Tax=Clostridium sp. D33t1_170424_F3 TaxID=2787099 RepID=UPI0018ABD225|nr:hypothetical protein [Clostridium sp. D33t1_170424_F3]
MNLLEWIAGQYASCTKDTKLIRFYHTQLIRRLAKPDRIMVLRIIDEKDLLIDQAAMESYQRGFAMGMALAEDTANVLRRCPSACSDSPTGSRGARQTDCRL